MYAASKCAPRIILQMPAILPIRGEILSIPQHYCCNYGLTVGCNIAAAMQQQKIDCSSHIAAAIMLQ